MQARQLTTKNIDPNGIYTLAEMAAVVRCCPRTLRNHKVKQLPKQTRNSPSKVMGYTILAYLGNPDIVRATETTQQRSKRADATMNAATAGL